MREFDFARFGRQKQVFLSAIETLGFGWAISRSTLPIPADPSYAPNIRGRHFMKIWGKAVICAALVAGAASASAQVFTVTYTGTVLSGTDYSGVFTQAGGSLAGLAYTSFYEFDSSVGIRNNSSPYLDTLSGGDYYAVASSLLATSLIINGVTFNLNGGNFSLQSNYSTAGQISSYASDNLGSSAFDANFMGNSLQAANVPTPIMTPYSATGTRAVGGYTNSFQIAYRATANSVYQNASGNLSPTSVVVAIQAVPEPATWGMMILGFGLVGGAMRSRRRLSYRVRVAAA